MRRDRRAVSSSDGDGKPPRLVTLAQAAELTGRSRTAIRRRCERYDPANPAFGSLQSTLIAGRRMVPVAELERVFGPVKPMDHASSSDGVPAGDGFTSMLETIRAQERELSALKALTERADATVGELEAQRVTLEAENRAHRSDAEVLRRRVAELEGRPWNRLFRRRAVG